MTVQNQMHLNTSPTKAPAAPVHTTHPMNIFTHAMAKALTRPTRDASASTIRATSGGVKAMSVLIVLE